MLYMKGDFFFKTVSSINPTYLKWTRGVTRENTEKIALKNEIKYILYRYIGKNRNIMWLAKLS